MVADLIASALIFSGLNFGADLFRMARQKREKVAEQQSNFEYGLEQIQGQAQRSYAEASHSMAGLRELGLVSGIQDTKKRALEGLKKQYPYAKLPVGYGLSAADKRRAQHLDYWSGGRSGITASVSGDYKAYTPEPPIPTPKPF